MQKLSLQVKFEKATLSGIFHLPMPKTASFYYLLHYGFHCFISIDTQTIKALVIQNIRLIRLIFSTLSAHVVVYQKSTVVFSGFFSAVY